jgi:hypothetical protein
MLVVSLRRLHISTVSGRKPPSSRLQDKPIRVPGCDSALETAALFTTDPMDFHAVAHQLIQYSV